MGEATFTIVDGVDACAFAAGGAAEVLVGRAVAIVVFAVTDVIGGAFKGIADLGEATFTIGDGVDAFAFPASGVSEVLVGCPITVVIFAVANVVGRA